MQGEKKDILSHPIFMEINQKRNSIHNNPQKKPKKPTIEEIKPTDIYETIQKLQLLVKEEEVIKERFKKNKEMIINQMNSNCYQFYKYKIGIKESFDYLKTPNKIQINYILHEHPKDILGSKYNDIYNLLFYLKNNNNLMMLLVNNIDNVDFEKFAYFMVHFLYENILNSSFSQEDLIVFMYLLIEKIVNNYNNSNCVCVNNLLKNTFINEIILQFSRKEDVRSFLIILLSNVTAELNKDNIGILNFSLENINREISMNNFSKDIDNINEEIIDKYLIENEVNLKYLKEKLQYYDSDIKIPNNALIKEYLKKQISLIEKSNKKEIFSNKNLIDKLNKCPKKVKKLYYHDIITIQELLDKLIHDLLDNITSIPYMIKCLCLIIDKLLKLKYPKTTNYERLFEVISFYFNSLIIPIVSNPEYNGSITTRILTNEAKINLNYISQILSKLTSGNLFTEEDGCEYSLLNYYIINNINIIFKLFSFMNDTKLPLMIERLIESRDSSNRNINYNYLKENHVENIQYQSICFDWNIINIIIKIIKKHKKEFDNICDIENKNNDEYEDGEDYKYENDNINKINLKNTINNFISFENDIETYIKEEEKCKKIDNKKSNNNEEITKKDKHFFYFYKIFYNKSFKDNLEGVVSHHSNVTNAFSFTNKLAKINTLSKTFAPDNRMKIKKEKEENKIKKYGIVPRIKRSICELLKFLSILNVKYISFSYKNNDDFYSAILPKLLEKVKYEISNNYGAYSENNNKENGNISIIFYVSYLVNNIKSLPQNYCKDNYNLLFLELLKEKEQSIKENNNNVINQLNIKLKNSEKLNMIINSNLNSLKQMEKLINVDIFINDFPIKVVLIYKVSNDSNMYDSFELIEINSKDEEKKYKKPKNKNDIIKICGNIINFIEVFPVLNNNKKVLENEEKLNINEILFKYLSIIKNNIKNSIRFEKYTVEERNQIYEEVVNYIMDKLYFKLYPLKPTKDDLKIYLKCKRINWIKPQYLIKEQKFINENLWKKAMEYINNMDMENSPRNKINSFSTAFNIIQNSITFCTGKDELGVDDSIQILLYVVVKSQPKRIHSNFNYSRLFMDPELLKKQYGLLLTQIEMIMAIINKMKYSDLIGVTQEQFGKDLEDNEIDENVNYY